MGHIQWICLCHLVRCRKTQEWRGKHSRKGQRNSWILADAGDGKWQISFGEIARVQRQRGPHSPFLCLPWQVSCNHLWNRSFLGSLCHGTRREACVAGGLRHLSTGDLPFPHVDQWQFVIWKAEAHFQNLPLNVSVIWWISACVTLCIFNNFYCPPYLSQPIQYYLPKLVKCWACFYSPHSELWAVN